MEIRLLAGIASVAVLDMRVGQIEGMQVGRLFRYVSVDAGNLGRIDEGSLHPFENITR